MKLETTIHKLLTNKIVLYIVSVVSILNVLGYLFYGNMNAVLYFAILAGLVYYFSKNMIIVLLVPLILVNLWAGSQYQINKVEGMTTSSESEESSTSVDLPPKNTESTSTPMSSSTSTISSTSTPILEENVPSGSESFKGTKKGNHKLDYSGTLSDTYSHLNEILGSEGMKSLTNDTKQLMEQQKQLAESMKGLEPILNSFGPLMKQAEGLLGGINGSGGAQGIGGIGGLCEMMKKFGGSKE